PVTHGVASSSLVRTAKREAKASLFCLKMKSYYVYIIYSATHDLYYKGYTSNLEIRLLQHNNHESRYTAEKAPWELVFIQSFSSKTEALKRERSLKKYSHDQLQVVIDSELNEIS